MMGLSGHEVTTQETEFGRRIQLFERCYQVGGMQVARCFTSDKEILHGSRRFKVMKSNS